MLGIYVLPLIGAVVMCALGYVWYVLIFGKHYANAMGVTPEMMTVDPVANKKSMMVNMIIDFVMSFIMLFGFLVLMNLAQTATYSSALIFAALFWAFIIMPNKASAAIWGGKSKKSTWTIFGLNAGYSLLSFLIVAPLFLYLVRFF